MTKKIFAMFLAVLMVVSMLPTSVFAADNCPGADAVHTKNNCDYTQVGEPVAPTCGTQGYTNYKCNECGKNFIADQVAAAGEHTWVDAKDEPETCLQNGKTGGKECSVCHAKVEQTEVDNIPNGFTCDMEDLTPTINCMTGGKKQYKCKVCGRTEEGEEIKENTPHTWKAWELKTAPTATENGLAERKCEKCGETEQVVVFAAHDHVMIDAPAVAPKCDVPGVKAHKVCRICNVKFGPKSAEDATLVEKTDEELAIPSLHAYLETQADCLHLTKNCQNVVIDGVVYAGCGKVINFASVIDHKWELNPNHANAWAATCTTAGNNVYTCKTAGCPAIKTEPVKPLGHLTYSTDVKATCIQYAYTFTYCVRANCAAKVPSKDVEIGKTMVPFDVTVGTNDLVSPVVGAGFALNMFMGGTINKTFYFTGVATNDKNEYLQTSDVATDAVTVFLEVAKKDGKDIEGGYWMYFVDDNNTKKYIEIYTNSANKQRVGIFSEPTTYWTWNETHKVLTIKQGEDQYYLGSYINATGTTYTTLSANWIGYLEREDTSNQCPAKMTISNAGGVALLDIVVNTKAGKDPENHNWKSIAKTDATCKSAGVEAFICDNNCGVASKQVVLPQLEDHLWNDGVVTKAETCTEKGEKLFTCQCKGCTETKKEEIPAKNHSPIYETINGVKKDVVNTVKGDHNTTTIYDYKTCYHCGEQIEKTNYRVWEGVGKIWNTLEEANKAHNANWKWEDGVDSGLTDSCASVNYKLFTCSCKETVRVKVAGTNEHLPYAGEGITVGEVVYGGENGKPVRVEATCTADGYYVNYKCSRCGELIDNTKKENEVVVLKAKGHTPKELTEAEREALGLPKKYEAAPCDQPNYYNYTHKCEVCDFKINDGTEKLNVFTVPTVDALCGPMVYEWYKCHCGENHMRNFVGEIKHVLENATDADLDALKELEGFDGKLKVDASCTAAGYVWKKCTFCGEFIKETLAKLPHENKAEEKFTDSCIDEVDDRHCVNCCNCTTKKDHDCTADQNKDVDGVQTCPCVIKANVHNWDRTETFVPSVCGSLPYSMRVCKDCGKTEITNYPGYWDEKTVDKDGKPVLSPIVGLNHTPVAYTTGDKYANLKYLPAEQYIYSLNENGILVLDVVSYEGIYKAYTEPTFTTAGSATFVCSQCGEEVTIEIPALSGLGFELVVENANGQAGITKGSVVNVTLYANGNNVEVNNFTLNAEFKSMIFVGAKPANDNFNIHVTKAEGANKAQKLEIVANAINTADKKQQNIAIGEKTPVVTLTFIAWGEGKTDVKMDGKAFALDAKGVEDAINCTPKACEIEIKALYDFNEDGFVHTSDLVQAEAILTGESEKTYDATVDADKDGEITLYDLNLIFEYMVNKTFMTEEELVEFACIGLTDEYVAIVRQYLNNAEEATKHECIGKYCTYSADEKFDVCPVCKTVQ